MEEGPIKVIDPDTVPKEPPRMIDGFEWVTMDLTDTHEVRNWQATRKPTKADRIPAGRGL